MLRRFHAFLALATLTARETLRQPLCLLLTATAVAACAILPLVVSHTLGESRAMMADTALALHLLLGMLLAGFGAGLTLTAECRRGTAASVLSKPVGRELFFLAKFAGLAAVMLLFSVLLTLAGMLAVRVVNEAYQPDRRAAGALLAALPVALAAAGARNYLRRAPFASGAFAALLVTLLAAFVGAGFFDAEGRRVAFGAAYDWALLPANALLAMALWVLAALALALATRLTMVPLVTLCSAVFFAGLMSDYLFGRAAAHSRWAAALYAAIPNWQHFWMADAVHLGEPIPGAYLARAALYAGFCLLALLAAGIVLFRTADVKA